jgi:head-tail adaptor
MLSSGQLKEKVTITREVPVDLPDGSQTSTWINILTTFCKVEQKTAGIDVISAQDNITQTMIFTLRYRTDIPFKIGDRLEWRDRDFKIHGFSWDSLRTILTIICNTHNETTDDGNPGS